MACDLSPERPNLKGSALQPKLRLSRSFRKRLADTSSEEDIVPKRANAGALKAARKPPRTPNPVARPGPAREPKQQALALLPALPGSLRLRLDAVASPCKTHRPLAFGCGGP